MLFVESSFMTSKMLVNVLSFFINARKLLFLHSMSNTRRQTHGAMVSTLHPNLVWLAQRHGIGYNNSMSNTTIKKREGHSKLKNVIGSYQVLKL